MSEVWKDITGYEGLYQVSDLGNVKSLDREVTYKDGKVRIHKGKLLKPQKHRDGGLKIGLYKNKKPETFTPQKLVMSVFIGPRPEGYQICHIDGNPLNNKLSNLRYDTQAENNIDCYRQKGSSNRGKYSIEQILEIRRLSNTNELTQKEIAEMFNTSSSYISSIVNRRVFSYLNDDGTIQESNTAVS